MGGHHPNVMQTGRTLLMRRAHDAFMARFRDVLRRLADLAEAKAATVMVARTNHRHALPITVGFKLAGWIEEWLRHLERFHAAAPRVFRAQWGGAVGAMHAIGPRGPELNRRLAARLGLGHLTVPSRAGLDYLGEYFLLLGLFAATCGRIAHDLFRMMSDEIGEVYEDLGDAVVGSSTMPHKANPKLVVGVIALSARVRAAVPLTLEAMQPSFEGDASSNAILSSIIDDVCPLAYELVTGMDELLQSLRWRRNRLRAPLDESGSVLASEQAMMALASTLGRGQAHELIHAAVTQSLETGAPLADTVLADPALASALPEPALRRALDPSGYIGLSAALTVEMVAAARDAVSATSN